MQNAAGAILGPFDSWLVLRGTKTLPLRMAQHNANGCALAEFLAAHPKVTHVYLSRACRRIRSTRWPARQMRGFGGMLAFDLGSLEAARAAAERRPADGAGREPRRRRDADLPPGDDDPRLGAGRAPRRLGITDGLVRISAGIEDIDDLSDDLTQALA